MPAISARTDTWIRRFHPCEEGAPGLVCFPHAGGSASYFFPVSASLTPKIWVRAVQYPGRQDRHAEPPLSDIGALAEHVFRELSTEDVERTWFFGHSMGAVIAFEVARRVEERLGASLAGVVVSGRRAPSRHRTETVHLQEDAALVATLEALSGTDDRLLADEEMRRMVLTALRSDFRAIETYRPAAGARLNCPVVAFVGDADPLTTIDEAEAWREHCSGAFTCRVFPGDHFYLSADPGTVIAALARLIVPDGPVEELAH